MFNFVRFYLHHWWVKGRYSNCICRFIPGEIHTEPFNHFISRLLWARHCSPAPRVPINILSTREHFHHLITSLIFDFNLKKICHDMAILFQVEVKYHSSYYINILGFINHFSRITIFIISAFTKSSSVTFDGIKN